MKAGFLFTKASGALEVFCTSQAFPTLRTKLSRGLDYELQDCALQLSDDGALTYNLQFGVQIFPDSVHMPIAYSYDDGNLTMFAHVICRKTLDRQPWAFHLSGLEAESLFTSDAVAISECEESLESLAVFLT